MKKKLSKFNGILKLNKSFDKNHYSKDYYASHGFYKKKYSSDEINEKLEAFKIYDYLIKTSLKLKNIKILEIGCGEGFGARYLHKRYNYTGIELTSHPFEFHNKKTFKKINFFKGDFIEIKNSLKVKYDVIIFHGVLEHLSDLNSTLKFINKNLNNSGLLLVNVPNDFSPYQKKYLKNFKIPYHKANFVNQEHKNYFTPISLKKLFKNFKCLKIFTNFPIDIFLLNKKTNFYINKKFGIHAYNIYREVEKVIKKDLKKYINLGEAQSDLGIGRTITACFKKH